MMVKLLALFITMSSVSAFLFPFQTTPLIHQLARPSVSSRTPSTRGELRCSLLMYSTSKSSLSSSSSSSLPSQSRTWVGRYCWRVSRHGIVDDKSPRNNRKNYNLLNLLSINDETNRLILRTAIPSMANLAVVPLVNMVDTYWVGRLGSALDLAGQSAANQTFFGLFFLFAFLPTITAPLVAAAVGRAAGDNGNNKDEASDRVCEALFLCNVLGLIGTILLVCFPRFALQSVLAVDAPAMARAVPYLRLRALGLLPSLLSSTGFAAYRGSLDTVTPLKVSIGVNLLNLVLDPIFIFGWGGKFGMAGMKGMGLCGAALATALSETVSGLVYLRLLLRDKLVRWSKLLRPPTWSNLQPLLKGGSAVLLRQLSLNISFLAAASRAQSLDPQSGVRAAAYGIVMQIYSLGIVVNLGMQSAAAALVPSARSASVAMGGGDDAARNIADRSLVWGLLVGCVLAFLQIASLPYIVPLFSTLPEVVDAVRTPAMISGLLQIVNGLVFAGEGIMMGVSSYGALVASTAMGVAIMIGCLTCTPLGKGLNGILVSNGIFHLFLAGAVVVHHLLLGPLSRRRLRLKKNGWFHFGRKEGEMKG